MAALGTVNLGEGRTATAISAGFAHTCALLDTGRVKCWGLNSFGQLGYDHTEDKGDEAGEMASLGTVDLGYHKAIAVTAGGSHTCALLDTGGLKCWLLGEGRRRGSSGTTAPTTRATPRARWRAWAW